MPVHKDPNGRRWVSAEVEVTGTPEQVWQAIATGPGISSWFVPTKVEEHKGGAVNASFGPGMDSVSQITQWDPPHRFVADSRDDMGPGDPTVATEWIVEARGGGKCVVRVVHSWFTSSEKWDNQFEGHTHGWVAFFRILAQYMQHFAGQPCTSLQLMAMTAGTAQDAWTKLTTALGFPNAKLGDRVRSGANAPTLSGIVESAGPPEFPEHLIRIDTPAPGLLHMFAMPMGGQVLVPFRFYLYGKTAAQVAQQIEPQWQALLNTLFPPPSMG